MLNSVYDLLVVGGGINGCAIAYDAAARGLSVLLVERNDFASGTSSASSKLIHGGLRYLEYGQFGLVSEALTERANLLRLAPHLVRPLEFVMPLGPASRPAWMVRLGLLLYDHIGGRRALPASSAVDLADATYGGALRTRDVPAYRYFDATVDDARMVLANALAARAHGATLLNDTELIEAHRSGGRWAVSLCRTSDQTRLETSARAIVNAAGPWVEDLLGRVSANSPGAVRLVKGSHILLPRLYEGKHAYILQNNDRRVVFLLPYADRYTLVGTTDIPHRSAAEPAVATDAEVEYLCAAANRYLTNAARPEQIIWRYSGLRPLYDDGHSAAQAVSREFNLVTHDQWPLLSVYGGKLTVHRKLACLVVDRLKRWFPVLGQCETDRHAYPGGDFTTAGPAGLKLDLARRYPAITADLLAQLALRHGSLAYEVCAIARSPADLAVDPQSGLCNAEILYFAQREWARSADDILWRRTKAALHCEPDQRASLAARIGALLATQTADRPASN